MIALFSVLEINDQKQGDRENIDKERGWAGFREKRPDIERERMVDAAGILFRI